MNKHTIEEVIILPRSGGYSAQLLPQSTIQLASERSTMFSRRLLVAIVFVLVSCSFPFQSHATTLDATSITDSTNSARAHAGVTTVTTNALLTQAAKAKANSMFSEQYFNHVSPTGVQPWSFMTAAGYAYTSAGENLAIDFVDSADVVEAWLQSPEHRKNLLDGKFTDMGVAVQSGTLNGVTTTIVVQFFGASTAPAVVTSSQPEAPLPTPTAKKTPSVLRQVTTTPVTVAPVQTAPDTQVQAAPIDQLDTANVTDLEATLRTPLVEGVSTKVIPTQTMGPGILASYNPTVSRLVTLVLAFYATLVVTLIALQKKTLKTTPLLAPTSVT